MSVKVTAGNFAMPTGAAGTTLTITGVGFQPTYVMFFMNGLTTTSDGASTAAHGKLAFGIAASLTDRRFYAAHSQDNVTPTQSATGHRADGCIGVILNNTPTWDGWIDIASFDSDGFTVKVGQQLSSGNAYQVHYLAVGGNEVTNVKTGTFTKSTSSGNQSITGVGFQPDAIIILGGHPLLTNALPDIQLHNVFGMGVGTFQGSQTQAVMGGTDRNALATSQCRHTQGLGSITMEWVSTLDSLQNNGQLVSLDSDGFTLSYSASGSALVYDYIALKGGLYNIGELITAHDTTTVNQFTGFVPLGGLQYSSQQPEDNFTIRTNNLLGIGCFDTDITEHAVTVGTVDAKNPSSVVAGASFLNTVAYVNPTGGFAQRTGIIDLEPAQGSISYQNTNADGDLNLFYILMLGAVHSNIGGWRLK